MPQGEHHRQSGHGSGVRSGSGVFPVKVGRAMRPRLYGEVSLQEGSYPQTITLPPFERRRGTGRSESSQRVGKMLRCTKDQQERSPSFMDEQQQQRINRAAEEFANALIESQRTMAERGVSAQEMNAQLTQHFFNNVITNLQRMTEETRGASQELTEQTQRAQEAARTLTQEATGAYMIFMNSLFAMSRGGVQRGAEETRRGS